VNQTEAGYIFAPRAVRPDCVVVVSVALQNLPQMSLTQDHEMIEALSRILDAIAPEADEIVLPKTWSSVFISATSNREWGFD
jgi:hypothetical protein